MKIALFQMKPEWEDKKKNYSHLDAKLKEIQGKKIDLLLLPEMSFTGFSMNTELIKEKQWETLKQMKYFAKQYNLALGFGWVKDCGEKSENHYTIVDKYGVSVSDYVKIHPFSYSGEDKKFRAGDEVIIFSLKSNIFSVFICYDLRFPEIFQIASRKADAIIVPANWPEKRSEHWKTLLKARAIENQVYIFAINCYGTMGGQYYSGDSCVINPNGQIECIISNEEGVLEYEYINDVSMYRSQFSVKGDRRPAIYYKEYNKIQ